MIAERAIDREMLALEPLLDDYDGVEIAAAALKLLERELTVAPGGAPFSAFASVQWRGAAAQTTGFEGYGAAFRDRGRADNVRPADLLSAIANQPGLNSASVGKIDIRQSHSTVEVAADSADAVIERLTGTTIRGRRVIARRDDESRRPRTTSDRPRRSAAT